LLKKSIRRQVELNRLLNASMLLAEGQGQKDQGHHQGDEDEELEVGHLIRKDLVVLRQILLLNALQLLLFLDEDLGAALGLHELARTKLPLQL